VRVGASLCQDEVAGDSVVDAAAGGLDALTKENGEVALVRAQGGDVVWLVVLVGARYGLAARDGGLGGRWVHHHHTVGGLGVDDGGNIEEVGSARSVEAELGEDTSNVGLSIIVGVGVSGPALRELLVDVGVALDGELIQGCGARGWGEDDVTSGTVLVDELGRVVGGDHGCERGGCEENGLGELHFEGDCVKF